MKRPCGPLTDVPNATNFLLESREEMLLTDTAVLPGDEGLTDLQTNTISQLGKKKAIARLTKL